MFDSRLREERIVDTVPSDDVGRTEAEVMPTQGGLETARAREARAAAQDLLEQQIAEDIETSVGLEGLAEHVQFRRGEAGLEIQIVDTTGRSMFGSGSARIPERTRQLLEVVAASLADIPNEITIAGHTDARQFQGGSYSNWELSADRANATRRALVENGVNPQRITRISGLADTVPLEGVSPDAAENRRISIMVLYPEGAPIP